MQGVLAQAGKLKKIAEIQFRLNGIQEVGGSIPPGSTNVIKCLFATSASGFQEK
jgi:hypothetical protein